MRRRGMQHALETIYVYYKLAGRRADMWAGSVGSSFGYFPKDLLAINHIYTEKEFEVPAEETDFVCFETGFDKFQSYDVDHLLEPVQTDAKPPDEEDINNVPEEQNASPNTTEPETVLLPSETHITPDTTVKENENEQLTLQDPIVEEIIAEVNETKDEPSQQHPEEENFHTEDIHEPLVTPSENTQIPELKTSYGTTFDAVVTEETATAKTTPQEEEMQEEPVTEAPLPIPDDTKSENSLVEKQDDPKTDEYMWSSLGDAVFSVVTGGEKTTHDLDVSSDEDEDDDDEEEIVPPPKTFEEIKADKQPLDVKFTPVETPSLISKPEEGHETAREILQEVDDTKPNSEGKTLTFESEGEAVDLDDKTTLKTEDIMLQSDTVQKEEPTQDEALPVQESNVIQENLETQVPNVEIDEEPNESNVTNDTEKTQESQDIVTQEEHLEENTSKLVVEAFSNEELPAEKSDLQDIDNVKKDNESKIEEETVDQNQENVGINSQPVSLKEEPMDKNNIEEIIEETEPDFKEEEVELLEDENALSLSQTDNAQPVETPNVPQTSTPEPDAAEDGPLTPTDDLTPEVVPVEPVEPEPVYSDEVMRLTILREHLSEEKMARCQKYLGLKNLFKLEAMFEDLETELQSTRLSQIGSVQEIENALERILEASENAILDEVEKILDSRESKYSDNQQVGSNIDEETEILDDFQELAFSLRHKYSTVSDSVPLAEATQDGGPDDQELNVKEDVPATVELIDNENAEEAHNLTSTHPAEEITDAKKPEGLFWIKFMPLCQMSAWRTMAGTLTRTKTISRVLEPAMK
ncbi:hypothetical protein WMY93_016235 [Mugilogobius chulae]|uniref:Uncharacterized protein n=1 Tax=Mugilogobius chulae TaxID=88201 RepID=A0AAW0NWQ2_9GOBI